MFGLTSRIRSKWSEPQGFKEILQVGFPLIVGMSSTTLMQFIDRVFLATYATEAIAAAVPAALTFLVVFLSIMGTAGYATVLIAQYVGSGAPDRVGSALWQGIWLAAIGGAFLASLSFVAEPIFAFAGHPEAVQRMEVLYFRTMCSGGFLGLLSAVMGSFFAGRGQTRPVLVANFMAACIKIPADYILIFGGFGIPSLGIVGAGLGSIIAWSVSLSTLAFLVFKKENEKRYRVLSGWRFHKGMMARLLRFGIPSGVNFFTENIAMAWFSMEVGSLGTVALAASNIAFSLNSLIFMPMLGMNMAISSLVGQSMGKGKVQQVERITYNSLLLVFSYMLPLVVIVVLFAGPLVGLFSPGKGLGNYAEVHQVSIILIYFIAVYSLVDAASIVYFGALKGAGDTLGILYMLGSGIIFFLVIPITVLNFFDAATLYRYWIAFTLFIMFLAFGARFRFKSGKWKNIRVVETAKN